MGLFHHDSTEAKQNAQIYNSSLEPQHHKATFTAEAISGAAAYEAAKAYQQHLERNGKPQSHAEAKRLLAGFAGAAIDHLFQTKGLDFIDKEKVKREAEHKAKEAVSEENLGA